MELSFFWNFMEIRSSLFLRFHSALNALFIALLPRLNFFTRVRWLLELPVDLVDVLDFVGCVLKAMTMGSCFHFFRSKYNKFKFDHMNTDNQV